MNSTEQAAGIPGGIAAGFFAQSYTLNGQKIIAYRGTDEPVTLPWSDIGGDVWNGYGTAFGLPFNDQARMAADFFQTVTGTQTTDPSTGNAILTGHSLGGGLAGFIGSIYRQSAYLFDNMSFELAANTARELGIINNTLGFALLTDFYNGLAPVQNLTSTNLRAFATTGELLSVIGNRIMQGTPVTFLDSYNNTLGMVQKHSMALHTMLQFAQSASIATDWQEIGNALWNAGFKANVANAALAGMPTLGGEYTNEYKLLTAIAYSAIDEGVRVFGDTGIRAMFNDANDIGGIVKLADGSSTIKQAAGALSDILMQYAGQLAFGKVLQSASPAALNGILAVDPGKTVLTVDLSQPQWEIGRAGGSAVPDIVGKQTLTDEAFGRAGTNGFSDTRTGMKWLWNTDKSDIIDRISFAAANDNAPSYMRMAA